MRFEATHGFHEHEQLMPQPFEVDVELRLNLQPAGIDDDLTRRSTTGASTSLHASMESTTFRLLEALAEAISNEILADFAALEVGVRIRKPEVAPRRAARLRRGRDLAAAAPVSRSRPGGMNGRRARHRDVGGRTTPRGRRVAFRA